MPRPDDRAIPPVPLALGTAGLIPFGGLALMHLGGWGGPLDWSSGFVRTGLATYGAVIASFLGGVRWGVAATTRDQARAAWNYAVGILPSLAAWFALALPRPWDLAGLGLLLLGLGFVDQDLVRRGEAPPWFGRLRIGLSAGAGLALIAGAFGG